MWVFGVRGEHEETEDDKVSTRVQPGALPVSDPLTESCERARKDLYLAALDYAECMPGQVAQRLESAACRYAAAVRALRQREASLARKR